MHSDLTLLEQVKLGKIWDFPGGIHPPERKHLSNQTAIATAELASHYYVPIKQHVGSSGELIVNIGDSVLKGQALTKPVSGLSLPVHAPTSGVVENIQQHVSAHPSGAPELTIIIATDGQDKTVEPSPLTDWKSVDKQQLINHIQTMGVAGLGGAAFPTYVKANAAKGNEATNIELLIINAVECEPYITADDVLMREYSDDIIAGIEILLHSTQAKHCLIGLEDNKPEAIDIVTKACAQHSNIDVRVVPTKYPSGGEKQLIQLLTNQQVPSKGLPLDLGIVMQNVGTAFAVKQAVIDGVALTERVVTVTGESITNPKNLWTKLGTSVADIVGQCGLTAEKSQRLIMGGPMMGFNIIDDQMPIVKATNCILAPSSYHLPPRGVEQACIRCGDCAAVCPAELLPQQLLWYSKSQEQEKLNEYDLFDCIECGACAYVCPSQIPLVQYYRNSKAEIRQAEEDKAKAEKAKIRFEQRQERLEREKEARLKRHKEAADRRKQAMNKDDSAKDKIAAALARAKAKKEQANSGNSDSEPNSKGANEVAANTAANAELSQEANTEPKDKVAAAIARAKAKKEQKAKEALAAHTNESVESKGEPETKEQTPPDAETVTVNETSEAAEKTPEQLKKERVAATIAKAKAKKLQAQQEANSQQVDSSKQVDSSEEIGKTENVTSTKESEPQQKNTAEEKTPEQLKKEKVAAAIAKAKAKKQQAQASSNQEESAPNESAAEEKTPEQLKKEKVAAAIAKAKAKKLKAQESEESQRGND